MIINPKMGPLTPLLAVGGLVALVALYMRPKPKHSTSFVAHGIHVRKCTDFTVRDSSVSAPTTLEQYKRAADEIGWEPQKADAILSYALGHMFPVCKFPNRGARFHEEGVTVTWDALVEMLGQNIERGFDPRREAAAPSVNWNRSVFLGVM